MSLVNQQDYEYNKLVNYVLEQGVWETGRNGNTQSVFGYMMRFNLKDNKIPLLTTKRVAWKTCLKELLWFISGNTNNKVLQEKNVHIWDGNGSREFLDSRGLFCLEENDLGPVYGHQWRHFNAEYTNCYENYEGKGVDQLQYIIDQLSNKETRTSRRIIMSSWNPCQIDEMALPPCHILCQFNVNTSKNGGKDQLSCSLYQRSGDIGLGVPFNIASYSMLTHLLAYHLDMEAKEFVHFIGNAHIYDDHVSVLQEQVQRPIGYQEPKLLFKNKHNKIDDYVFEDFEIVNYHPAEVSKMKMRV